MRGKLLIVWLFVTVMLNGCGEAKLKPFASNQLWGYRDAAGKVVIAPKYILAEPFSKYGIAAVVDPRENRWIYIDTRGRLIIRPLEYDNGPDYFVEGLARFREGGRVGFFNERGLPVIPAKFEFAFPFRNGFALVAQGVKEVPEGEHTVIKARRWGFIDKKGRLVIPYRFEAVLEPFQNPNYALMIMDGEKVKVNREGKVVGR